MVYQPIHHNLQICTHQVKFKIKHQLKVKITSQPKIKRELKKGKFSHYGI